MSTFIADIDKSSLRLVVLMDDDGDAAELIIQNNDDDDDDNKGSIVRMPTKPRNSSLLDDEQNTCYTSTPEAKSLTTLTRSPSSADETMCCGKLEGTIEALLSRSIATIEWQIWSWPYLGLANPKTASSKEDAKKTIKKALQNRAFSLTERRRRMNEVRREQSPFGFTTPTRTKKAGSPLKLGTVNSFNLVDLSTTGKSLTASRQSKSGRDTTTSNISSLTMTLCGCDNHNMPEVDSPAIIRSSMLEAVHENTCYDSDPEDFGGGFGEEGSPGNNKENTNNSRIVSRVTDSEAYLCGGVQEFLNERFTLILHTPGCAPRAVKAWFERGQYLNSYSVMQPRLSWLVLDHTSMKRRGGLNVQKVSSIDLVDVCRVLAVEQIDRALYPFAKPAACFLIKTLEASYLFETKTKEDRVKIVRWMKVTVSRLASKLITGDRTLFEEFFLTGMIDNGPGEAPDFF